MPVNPNYQSGVNAASQEDDPNSMLNFYRQMLRLRRNTPALIAVDYQALDLQSEDYLVFQRRDAETGQTCLVALNFSSRDQAVRFKPRPRLAHLLFSSHARPDPSFTLDRLQLASYEVFITELRKT